MKTISYVPILLLAMSVAATAVLSGCSVNMSSVAGTNISDLESAKADGSEKTYPVSVDSAYDTVISILRENKLTVFQADRQKGYIVAMGFRKQVNTTRVGIFFEASSDGGTRITLTSMSDTALVKAEDIIFREMDRTISR